MPKISELTTIADADLTLKDLIPLVDRDAAGNVIVGTKNMTVEQSRRLTALDVTLASIASNTVAVTGPAWGVTTDDKVVFLPAGGSAVDTGSGVDWTETGGGLDTDATIVANTDDDLAAKYAEAKALTPNGSALSATNRATLVIMPGTYALSATLTCDANFVDVIGLGAGEKSPKVLLTGGTFDPNLGALTAIKVTAHSVLVQGIEEVNNFQVVGQSNITGVTGTASNNRITIAGHGLAEGDVVRFTALTGGTGLSNNVRYLVSSVEADYFLLSKTFTTDITDGTLVVDNNTRQVLENCVGGSLSFGGSVGYNLTASGTFINCVGGNYAFAGEGTASGTFTNCTGGDNSFGYINTASGTFTNCVGGNDAFAGQATASGTFTNCVGRDRAFGGQATASGTFTDCTGGSDCFGLTASGTFINCTGGSASFGYLFGTASGTFINCIGGGSSFSEALFSGVAENCTGGDYSFGAFGTLSGKLYRCRLTGGTFQTVSGGGITRLCIDGNNAENNQG
jgi:hypothetical protein